MGYKIKIVLVTNLSKLLDLNISFQNFLDFQRMLLLILQILLMKSPRINLKELNFARTKFRGELNLAEIKFRELATKWQFSYITSPYFTRFTVIIKLRGN